MGSNNNGVVDLYVLPEGCIANALSLTSPRDACRLSLVASIFRSAAESDDVWERFLPSDYRDIMATSVDYPSTSRLAFASKKQLYLHLCDHPLIIDGGTKSFSLEKWSGKKCYMLAARELSIVWGDSPRYWKWISLSDSRFEEVAELMSVCWLEISGKIKTSILSWNTTYASYLVFKSTGAYGFEYQPAEASMGLSGGESETRTVYLDPDRGQRNNFYSAPRRIGIFNHRMAVNASTEQQQSVPIERNNNQYPRQRGDGWLEIELGEYVNKKGEEEGELKMSLMEVKGGNWKSGLIVQGIEIRPKEEAK